MKQTNNNRKSKFLALCLSVMMVSSAGALFASCADGSDSSSSDSSSSSSSSSEIKDTGLIKNSGFETFDTNKGLNAIGTSVTGWSRSTNSASSGSALSSKSASGIVDLSADAWDYLTGSYYESKEARDEAFKTITEADAIAKWDDFKVGDKLAYYDVWKEANKDGKISQDFEKYEAFNIDAEDIPDIANPGLRDGVAEDDTNVLMLHNNYYTTSKKTQGTAQKYTSSSTVTVPAGSSAKVSVWVRTADLKTTSSSGESQDAVNKGAYISVTHSIGSKSLQALEVKNINTEEWTQYTFYLKGSSYTKTTFSLVFGLGKGGGTDVYEYVNGYAFFDDVECELITNDDYKGAVEGKVNNEITDINAEAIDKTFNAYETDDTTFAMNYYSDWNDDNILNQTVTAKETTDDNGYTTNAANNPAPWLGGGFSTEIKDGETVKAQDVAGVYTKAQLAAMDNLYLDTVYEKFLGDENGDGTAFVANEDKILMLFSTNGVAYTAESEKTFTLSKDYLGISFYVKTSDLGGATGAGVTLVDDLTKTSFAAIDTSSMAGVTVGDTENVYDGWQKYFFFVEKDEDVDSVDFKLQFTYGPTDISSATAKTSYAEGFAAFAKFQVAELDQAQYDSVTADTYVKKVTVSGHVEDEATGDSGFDSAAGVPTNALEAGLANLQNYKGVYSDSYRVGNNYVAADDEETQIAKRQINQYANAGLLNREEFLNYYDGASTEAWMAGITANANGETEADKVWNAVFGDATQPLFIWNDGAVANKSYGFIGASKSLSEEYTAVSVRVKTGGGAVASVYLVDMDDDYRQNVLTIGRKLTFWYDDEGNVCTGDPTKKSTQIAFKLNKNGLYEANKNWSEYATYSGKFYANLSNYAKDSEGNLVSAEGGATHDYYSYEWNREVFYFNAADNGYYTDKTFTTRVYNLADVSDLEARYEAVESKQLMLENINTNGEWVTVTFYLRKGDDAKNYRLEVWSGTRSIGEGENKTTPVVNPANSYVIFDTNNPGTASSNYTNLLTQYEDKATDKFEGVFSYYDSDKFVRYDADMDEDKSGNAYEYTASSYTAATAYLFYKDDAANSYTVFADYTLSEKTIIATEKSEDTTEDDSSEEETDSTTNVWLLASSIAVAAVLVLAVASIGIRKVIENSNRKKGARTRITSVKKTAQKPVAKKAAKKEEVDEDSPYND